MPSITLTRGKVTSVDTNIFKTHGHLKWYAALCDGKFYATRFEGRKCVRLHRVVTKAKKHEQVDHINGDTLDNRRKNLRACNQSQNNANSKKRLKSSSSKYKGVSWLKSRRKWQVFVGRKWEGYFSTEKQAARAYNRGAKRKYGAFAKVNPV